MASLRVPSALVVVTVVAASAGCAPRPSPSDAQSDVQSDVVATDAPRESGACVPDDASPFPERLCGRIEDGGLASCGPACDDGTCTGSCRLCVASRFEGTIGRACLPRAGSSATCPDRVCQPGDCPSAGCETCESPLFCIPDRVADAMVPERCTPGYTCDPNGCGSGCRAVG